MCSLGTSRDCNSTFMNKKHKNPTCAAWVQGNQQPRHRAQTRGGRIG